MNHYFMLNGFTSQALLNGKVAFVSVNDIDTKETRSGLYPDKNDPAKLVYRMKIEYRSTVFKRKNDPIKLNDYYLVHFVGLSLNGVAKLKCIDQFITDKNVCL